MLSDLRSAVRALRATPVVTIAAVLSLALTIGANTAIFSILNALVLRSLPVREPERLVHVTDTVVNETGATRLRAWSYPAFAQIRQRTHLFEAVTAWSFIRFNRASGGQTQFVEGLWADGAFFETLGVHAVIGRTFSDVDDQPDGGPHGPVTVISSGCWQRLFGGAPDVVGRSVQLNGVPFTIVGVTPPHFFGPEVGRTFDFIVPVRTEARIRGRDSVLESAATNFLTIVARLRPGQSLDQAAAGLRRSQAEIRDATMEPWSKDVADRYLTDAFTVVPAAAGSSNLRRSYERPLLVIAVIVALVLLIGCVNIANLMLARAIGRRHELSVRLAIGASKWRLGRQLLAESMVLAGTGAALGLVFAAYCSRFLVGQLATPTNLVHLDVSIDGRVLFFTAAVAMLTTLLFGTAPALRAARAEAMDALRCQSRASSDPTDSRMMGWLLVGQVALSVVLVAAAGVFTRSFVSLASQDLGIRPGPVLVVTVDPHATAAEPIERVALYERVRDAVHQVPNVAEASISHVTPVGGGGFTPAVAVSAAAGPEGPGTPQTLPANQNVFGNLVSPGWFGTFGTPLVAGRDFSAADRRGAPRVAIVNETFARRFLDGDPLGRSLTVYPDTPRARRAEVVGVVANAVYTSPREPAPPTWYVPIAQFDVPEFPFTTGRLSVRARTGSPALLTKSLEAAVAAVDPRLALTFRPLEEQIHGALTRERLIAQLAAFLGGLAVLLAGLGLHGVTAYAMSRRRAEIGIRLALGAAPASVIRLALTRVSLLVGAGIVAGAAVSVWASRFIGPLVYGLTPHDPTTLAGAALVLAATGALAGGLPARRASRIDPAAVLRES